MKKILFAIAIASALFGYVAHVHASTLSIVTAAESIKAGEEFALDIKLDTESASVNAVQATVQYPNEVLEAVRIDKANSVFNFWLEEPNVDTPGAVRFTTGSTSGLSGKSLQVLRIVFRMKGNGSVNVSLTNSAVTAADGAGTNVLNASNGLKIVAEAQTGISQEISLVPKPVQIQREPTIANVAASAPAVRVPFYSDSTLWHNLSSPFLVQWDLPSDVSDVAAVINHDPTFAPTVGEGLFDDKMFPALPDGLSYLHVRFKNSRGWGTTAHYRLAIDTAPPVGFNVAVTEGNPSAVPNPTIEYKSGDQLSGLYRYAIRVDNRDTVFTNTPTHIFDPLPPGVYRVRVAAEDNAGNSSETTIQMEILPIPSPILASVNRELFVGEGNLFAGGSAAIDVSLALTLTDAKGTVVSAQTITPNSAGEWSVNIDTPLKRGAYTFTIIARDARGAMSYPVMETITVRPRPLLTIFGVGISPFWFYTFTSIIMLGAIVLGILIERYRRRRRSMRVFVLERDATNLIKHLREDIDLVSSQQQGTVAAEAITRAQIHLKKMEDYVIESMGKINK